MLMPLETRPAESSLNREVSRGAIASARWSLPLTIKAIVLDLDGTIMPTYKTLDAIHHINDHVTVSDGPSFIDYCIQRYEFHPLLHNASTVRRAAIEYAGTHSVCLSPAAVRGMIALQEQSCSVYEGLKALLDRARMARTFLAIYTNTSCHCAISRMSYRLAPRSVDAIWAKHDQKGSISPSAYRMLLSEYLDLVIPYTYSKPNDRPLRELAALTDAAPHEILLIGDGINDLEVVYGELSSPRAIFCFQMRGAADISQNASMFSARWPGRTPLGVDAVNRRIELYNIEHDIIRLENGFVDLLDLIEEGQVRLAAPNCIPTVQGNLLMHGCTLAWTGGVAVDRERVEETVSTSTGIAASNFSTLVRSKSRVKVQSA
jgi:phosphoglycolate phosphatase-like HAD superfamily hydrolase